MGANDDPYGDTVASSDEESDGELYHSARERVLTDFERRYLTTLLNRANGNMSKAARIAGVDRTTLYRLMEKQGMQRETMVVEWHVGDQPAL